MSAHQPSDHGMYLNDLHKELVSQLDSIDTKVENELSFEAQSVRICQNMMNRLREFIRDYVFPNKEEEISFFKDIKPKFYSKLIFHHRVFEFLGDQPQGDKELQLTFIQDQINNINLYNQYNKFLYQYLKTCETYLDHILFVKHSEHTPIAIHAFDLAAEPSFSTSYDYAVSRIMANDLLLQYLNNRRAALSGNKISAPFISQLPKLKWTDSNVALVELSYALKFTGSFNNGTADVKLISEYLERVFDVELGNTSRVFQSILARQSGYTTFIRKMDHSLTEYIKTII